MKTGRIRSKILLPLGLAILAILGGTTAAIHSLRSNHTEREVLASVEGLKLMFARELSEDRESLGGLLDFVEDIDHLSDRFRAGDRPGLLARAGPVFDRLRQHSRVTRFCFHNPDRTCFLRMHHPSRHGDRIDRFTMNRAVETGEAASGIELDPLGTLTLRVVHPWRVNGELVGYLELGEEIDHIAARLQCVLQVELVFLIRKAHLNREKWEERMWMMRRQPDWNEYAGFVVVDRTVFGEIPALRSSLTGFHGEHDGLTLDVEAEERRFRAAFVPLLDAAGDDVGRIVLLKDVGAHMAALDRTAASLAAVSILVLTALLGFFWVFLGRIQARIHRSSQELLASNRRRQMILDTAATAVFFVDTDKTITSVNRELLAKTGFSEEDIVGQPCSVLCGNACTADCALFDSERGQDPIRGRQSVVVTRDGRELRVRKNASVLRDDNGNVRGGIESFIDITALVLAEKSASREAGKLRSMIEGMDQGIVLADADNRITEINTWLLERIHSERETVLGQDIDKFRDFPSMRRRIHKIVEEFRSGGRTEVVIVNQRLRGAFLSFRVQPIFENGRYHGAILNVVDVTPIEEARRAAEAVGVAKAQFLANMSHEIRTPLNAIVGMTGLLLDTRLDEDQSEFASTIRAAGDSLLHLISDILDFSKIDSEKLDIEEIPYDLRYVVEGVGELLASACEGKDIEFTCFVDPDAKTALVGDPERLRQILVNLVGNAIKFTQKGNVNLKAVTRSREDRKMIARFTVEDTGPGIPEDRLTSVFDSFTQADGSTTRRYGGTGLGLSISKGLIELMGGEIGVESVEGQGTTFWCELPIVEQDEHVSEAGDRHRRHRVRGSRILVIDDNRTNRAILTRIVRSFGCTADEASLGQTGLDMLARAARNGEAYDAVLLDYQMPGMDGKQVALAIRKDLGLSAVRVLLLTSQGRRGDARRFQDLGCSAYLTKPIRQSQLLDALSTALAEGDSDAAINPAGIITRHSLAEHTVRHMRILLVEDNAVNQKVAVRILSNAGHCVDAVWNGSEAVAAIQSVPYDLVLMDVQMPVMDGLEATAAIRAIEGAARHIPIIAMTAHALTGDRERCIEAGMDDYLAKPVRGQDLLDIVRRWGGVEVHDLVGEDPPPPPRERLPVDLRRIEEVAGNDEKFVAELMELFLTTTEQGFLDLDAALAKGNAEKVQREAHKIKGSAGHMGAARLQKFALAIETAARAGDLEKAVQGLPELRDEFAAARDFLLERGD